MVVNHFPGIVDSVSDMVDIFLKKLTLAITVITITVYFSRHILQIGYFILFLQRKDTIINYKTLELWH